ncbi:MAG: hypothetical protein Q8Q09_04450 [Deltaproteobacteria bacterium]|nr:hypothetical protein [Deltaproteobacteria bacterium]
MQSLHGLIARLAELRPLTPDAEADACGTEFEQFVRDRMDEWHAALAAREGTDSASFAGQIEMVRTYGELHVHCNAHRLSERVVQVLDGVDAELQLHRQKPDIDAAVVRVMDALRPEFVRSMRWQSVVERVDLGVSIPWLVHALAESVLCVISQTQVTSELSLFAPWIALWERGVWPVPIGDGGIAVWIPRADEDALAMVTAMASSSSRVKAPSASAARLGFVPPRVSPVMIEGVSYGGALQTAGLDTQPALQWRPMGPPPTMNLPMSPFLNPYEEYPPVAAGYGAPPGPLMPPTRIPEINLAQPPTREPPQSALARLRRWLSRK